jgi:hypothetical protein
LRTQLTSPRVPTTQRRPLTSTTATAVVRGRPVLRPRMVMRVLGPIGIPRPIKRRATVSKTRTNLGARVIASAFVTSGGPHSTLIWSELDEAI